MPASKILEICVQNIQRVKLVRFRPKGNMVQITGANGQGKTSFLDAVEMLLCGKDAISSEPIRRGAESGKAEMRLLHEDEELRIERSITKKGSYLAITNPEGVPKKSPQALLERFFGTHTVDPLAFIRMSAKEQAEIVRRLARLDFTEFDAMRQAAYDERTVISRQLKAEEAALARLPEVADAPARAVDVQDVSDRLTEAMQTNSENERVRLSHRQQQDVVKNQQAKCDRIQQELLQAQSDLAAAKRDLEVVAQKVKALQDIDTAAFHEQIRNATALNQKHQRALQRSQAQAKVDALAKREQELTETIANVDDEKKSIISSAAFPVAGLGFDADGGVTFNGIPFSQASAAEKLRVSTAIALAGEQPIKLLLIRDGSLLDSENLALLNTMADESNALVLIERVDETGKVGVYIEDGESHSTDAQAEDA